MLQTVIESFNCDNEINDFVAKIENCKYCTVKDIRILKIGDNGYSVKTQIVYDYDIEAHNKDLEEAKKNQTTTGN